MTISIFLIDVQLIYNLLISAAQKSASVVHIYVYTYTRIHSLFKYSFPLWFVTGYLNMISFAIQQDLVGYPFSIQQFPSASPKLPLHPSPNPLPLHNHELNLFSVSETLLQISSFVQMTIFKGYSSVQPYEHKSILPVKEYSED